MIYSGTVNGINCRFDYEHYSNVRSVRELKEIPLLNQIVINKEWHHYYHEGNKLIEHPLLYKVIQDKKTKTLYIITKVVRQFLAGFYTVIQYDDVNGSSGIIVLSNETSIAIPTMTHFYSRFEVTDITKEHFFKNCNNCEWFYKHVNTNDKVFKHFTEC